jgi:hypothetical protein
LQFSFPIKSLCTIGTGVFSCRDNAKIRHPNKKKKRKKEKLLGTRVCFFPQFRDAAEVAIIQKII